MKKVLTLATLIFLLFAGLACATNGENASNEKASSKQTDAKPTEEGASDLAERYYELIVKFEYEKVYDLLGSKDKKFVNKDTYLNRLRQSYESVVKTSIVSVMLTDDNKAEVSATNEIEGFDSTKTILTTNIFSFDSKKNSWHPFLSQRDLFFYGSDPDSIGINEAAKAEQFSLPLFDAEVISAKKDSTLNEQGQNSISVILRIVNKAENGDEIFIFDPSIFTALSDSTQLLIGPNAEDNEVARIEPEKEASVKVMFSSTNNDLSILVGSDDNHYLVPLGF